MKTGEHSHMKGPWIARENLNTPGRYEIRPSESVGFTTGFAPLAYVQGDKRVTGGDGKDLAALIVKAPDMRDALMAIANGDADPVKTAKQVLKSLRASKSLQSRERG